MPRHAVALLISILLFLSCLVEAGLAAKRLTLREAQDSEKAGDYATAAGAYEILALEGDPTAQYHLARAYYLGKGVPKKLELALKWYGAAAKAGIADAQYIVGFMHQYGQGTAIDHDRAVQWFRLGASNGDLRSINGLGVIHLNFLSAYFNPVEAERYFRRAAEAGLADAQFNLARAYAEGHLDIPDRPTEAYRWLRRAEGADPSNEWYAYYLGLFHQFGFGVERNMAKAASWFRRAAELGNDNAPDVLGRMYFYGADGVARDPKEARKWLLLSAEGNNPRAMYMIGRLHEQGDGVASDIAEAARWYGRAAARDEGQAQYRLGMLYLKGEMFPASTELPALGESEAGKPDYRMAFVLLSLAARRGVSEAIPPRDVAWEKLNAKSLAELRKVLGEWEPLVSAMNMKLDSPKE